MKKMNPVGGSLMAFATVVLAACGGSDTTTTVVEKAATTPATTPTATATVEAKTRVKKVPSSDANTHPGSVALAPPAGSDRLNTSDRDGVEFARYANSGKTPAEVVASYKSKATAEGWKILKDGGGGGGWGPYGGSNYWLQAQKGKEYFDVEAGGQKGHATYFAACSGAGARAICDELSNDAHTGSGGSRHEQNQNQTNSRHS
ncbi:MAG: hypothetical protein NTV40_05660 [Solirubrobacterales bacterium]|nr:hypothetical protein [Solirubrobacterales bacterium]